MFTVGNRVTWRTSCCQWSIGLLFAAGQHGTEKTCSKERSDTNLQVQKQTLAKTSIDSKLFQRFLILCMMPFVSPSSTPLEGPSSRRWRQRAWQSQPFSLMQAWTAHLVFDSFNFRVYLWSWFPLGIWPSWKICGGLSNFETHVVGPTFSDEGLKKTRCAQETRGRSC